MQFTLSTNVNDLPEFAHMFNLLESVNIAITNGQYNSSPFLEISGRNPSQVAEGEVVSESDSTMQIDYLWDRIV